MKLKEILIRVIILMIGLCMLCGGPISDLFSIVLKPLFDSFPSLFFKLPMLAAGCVILAYGMTVVIKSDAGTIPE